MTDHRLYNPGRTSVVFDTAGHTVDGNESIEGNPNGQVLSRLITSGQLTDLGPVEDSATAEEVLVDDDASNESTEGAN